MKSLVFAVKSSIRAELLYGIMDASAHIRNDKPSLTRSCYLTFTKVHSVHR